MGFYLGISSIAALVAQSYQTLCSALRMTGKFLEEIDRELVFRKPLHLQHIRAVSTTSKTNQVTN